MRKKLKIVKGLGIVVSFLGILGFVSPDGGWFILPITIAVGTLIFSLAIITEIIVKGIESKNEYSTKKDELSSFED